VWSGEAFRQLVAHCEVHEAYDLRGRGGAVIDECLRPTGIERSGRGQAVGGDVGGAPPGCKAAAELIAVRCCVRRSRIARGEGASLDELLLERSMGHG